MIRRRTFGRAGFTLIELLITIGIMAIIASVVLVVINGMGGVAKVAATKSTIRKIDSLLTKRMEAFTRAIAEQDQVAKGAGKAPLYVKAAGMESLYNSNPVQATALARKITFRQQFPQRFSEVSSFSTPSKHTADTESAEMLYYLITSMPAFGTEAPDADNFSSSEVADTDQDGLKEFVDAWGKPLRFYRWPTRLIRPVLTAGNEGSAQTVDVGSTTTSHEDWTYGHPINLNYDASSGAVANVLLGSLSAAPGVVRGPGTTFEQEHADPLARDPDDPLGSLHPSARASASSSAQQFERNFHTNDTYHTPLIVSAGVDGALGLYEPNDTAKFGQLAQPNLSELSGLLDNITNRNLRAGGE